MGPYRSKGRSDAERRAISRYEVPSEGLTLLALASACCVGSCLAGTTSSTLVCTRVEGAISCELRSHGAFSSGRERIDGAQIDVLASRENRGDAVLGRAALRRAGARWSLFVSAPDSATGRDTRPAECLLDPDEPESRGFFRNGRGRAVVFDLNRERHNPMALTSIVVAPLFVFALGAALLDLGRARGLRFDRERRVLRVRSLRRTLFDRALSEDERAGIERQRLVIRAGEFDMSRESVEGEFDERTHEWLVEAQRVEGRPERVRAGRDWIVASLVAIVATVVWVYGGVHAAQRPHAEDLRARACAGAKDRR